MTVRSFALTLPALIAVVLGGLVGASCVLAHEGDGDHHHARPVKPAELYRPTGVPDRICLSLTETPDTAMAITWRTDLSSPVALAEYAIAGDGPDFVRDVQRVSGKSEPLTSDLGQALYHEARLDGLQPATKYLYRVGDGENWSEWSEFKTASTESEPFSFVYFGDAQNDVKSHWSRVVRNAFRDAPHAAFFLHAGDLINRAESDAEWGEWFYASGFIHRTLPAIAVPGNHEMARRDGLADRVLSHHWRPTFAFPENGPPLLQETCFYIDYQGVRLVCLNSNQDQARQVAWADKVLAEAPGWKIVTHHHPIYSASKGRDNPELRSLWQPIYDKHHVDLVLQGHDHTYARSGLMRQGDEQIESADTVEVGTRNVAQGARTRDDGGTVYVVSVSGPKMYDLNKRPFMQSSAERTQLYQVITVDGDSLHYKACTATGRLYDAFELQRRSGAANELIEKPVNSSP